MWAIKFHGPLHQYPLDGENYKPVLEYAESNNLTILCHLEYAGPKRPGLCRFVSLKELSSEYRNVNFLIVEAGT